MKTDPVPKSIDSLIEQYNRELMRFYERSAARRPAAETPDKAADSPLKPVDELLKEYPVPAPYQPGDGQAETPLSAPPVKRFDYPAEQAEEAGEEEAGRTARFPLETAPAEAKAEEQPAGKPPLVPLDMSVGYLQIRASSSREAEPIPGAIITVTRLTDRGEELYIHTTTDEDGLTAVFPVPAVDSELTLEPGIPSPYTSYNIQAYAPGFFRVLNVNAPVYGGNTAVQPVNMIPLPEYELSAQDLVFFQTGPKDL